MATIGLVLLIAGGLFLLTFSFSLRLGFGKKSFPSYGEEEDADKSDMLAIVRLMKMVMNGLAGFLILAGIILMILGRFYG